MFSAKLTCFEMFSAAPRVCARYTSDPTLYYSATSEHLQLQVCQNHKQTLQAQTHQSREQAKDPEKTKGLRVLNFIRG